MDSSTSRVLGFDMREPGHRQAIADASVRFPDSGWRIPRHTEEGAIIHRFGGRGVYFADPGDNVELLTRSMPSPPVLAAG